MPGGSPIRQGPGIVQWQARGRQHPAAACRDECSECGLAQGEAREVVAFGHIVSETWLVRVWRRQRDDAEELWPTMEEVIKHSAIRITAHDHGLQRDP